MKPFVKICGITNIEDARIAVDCGADYLGVLVEVAISPRSKTIAEAKEIFASSTIPVVALVYKMPIGKLKKLISQLKPFALQFVVEEDFTFIKDIKKSFPEVKLWQSLHLPADEDFDIKAVSQKANEYVKCGIDTILLDTVIKVGGKEQLGGTGKTSNWELAAKLIPEIHIPTLLAGGLNPSNVAAALTTVNPWGVDVSSGVELVKGKKDEAEVSAFIKIAKSL